MKRKFIRVVVAFDLVLYVLVLVSFRFWDIAKRFNGDFLGISSTKWLVIMVVSGVLAIISFPATVKLNDRFQEQPQEES